MRRFTPAYSLERTIAIITKSSSRDARNHSMAGVVWEVA